MATTANKEEEEEEMMASALDWSVQQTRILTAHGRANEYYTAQRGFAFDQKELPHYHLLLFRPRGDGTKDNDSNNETRVVFRKWARQQQRQHQQQHPAPPPPPFSIVGPWKRTLFFNHEMDLRPELRTSTDATETVYNLQTNTLFVDLRLPMATRQILHEQLLVVSRRHSGSSNHNNKALSLQDLNAQQLRLYARQHVFAGYTRMQSVVSATTAAKTATTASADGNTTHKDTTPATVAAANVVNAKLLCTRHHCIDWNFVGTPRARPNKWWVEPVVVVAAADGSAHGIDAWNEWAYATNHHGQHYYCERWERLTNKSNAHAADDERGGYADMEQHEETQRLVDNLVLALRKMPSTTRDNNGRETEEQDGVIVCVGNHFNYCLYTQPQSKAITRNNHGNHQDNKTNLFSSLVDLVDDAVARGDLDYARAWLGRIQAGHGYITTATATTATKCKRGGAGWMVNAAIPQWHEQQQQQTGGSNHQQSPLWQCRDEIKVVSAAASRTTTNTTMADDDVDLIAATTMRSWPSDYCVSWKGELWEILECNLTNKTQLETVLWLGLNASSRL